MPRFSVALAAAVAIAVTWWAEPQGQAPGTQNSGSVSGRVTEGSTGAPVEGAVVTLMGGIASRQVVDRQATDRLGRFVFAAIPAAVAHELRAAKPGYFDGTGRRFVLAANEWVRDAAIKLWKPASINGMVRDELGAPVVGVYVAVLASIFAAGVPQVARGPYAKTDDRGEYHIGPLPSGSYVVVVSMSHTTIPDDTPRPGVTSAHALLPLAGSGFLVTPPGYPIGPAPAADGRRQAYPTTYHPQARSLVSATLVDLTSGDDRTGIDLQLQPVTVFRVSGRLEGPPEAVAHRRIRLVAAGTEEIGIGHETALALTAADGAFTFVDVPEGTYTILAASGVTGYDLHPQAAAAPPFFDAVERLAVPFGVRATGPAFAAPTATVRGRGVESGASIRSVTFALNPHDAFVGRWPIAVSGTDQAGIVVPLQRGVSLTGRFVVDTRDQAALSATIAYLEVAALPAGGEPSRPEARGGVVPTAPALDFAIKDLLPGDYVLRVIGDGPMTKTVMVGGVDVTGQPITVPARGLTGVVVTVTSQAAQVRGQVRDAQGRPATQAAVIHFPVDSALWRRFGTQPERLRSVLVEGDGRFEIPGMPAGEYFLLAVDDELADRWKDPDFLESAARSATRVSVGWGEAKLQDLVVTTVTW